MKADLTPPVFIEGQTYRCVEHDERPAVEDDLGNPMCSECRERIMARARLFGSTPLIIPNWVKRYAHAISVRKACEMRSDYTPETAERFAGLIHEIERRLPKSIAERGLDGEVFAFRGQVEATGRYQRFPGKPQMVDIFEEYEQDFHPLDEDHPDFVAMAQKRKQARSEQAEGQGAEEDRA